MDVLTLGECSLGPRELYQVLAVLVSPCPLLVPTAVVCCKLGISRFVQTQDTLVPKEGDRRPIPVPLTKQSYMLLHD